MRQLKDELYGCTAQGSRSGASYVSNINRPSVAGPLDPSFSSSKTRRRSEHSFSAILLLAIHLRLAVPDNFLNTVPVIHRKTKQLHGIDALAVPVSIVPASKY